MENNNNLNEKWLSDVLRCKPRALGLSRGINGT